MRRFPVCLAVAAIVIACHGAEPPKSGQASVQQQAVVTDVAQADSARAFVQRFYDWYLATEARKGSPYDSLLTTRRGLLGDSLFRAFQADVAVQRADTVPEIASVSAEADIFLSSQDPCEHYTARPARAAGPDAFAVVVAGNCEGLAAQPNLEVYVRRTTAGWQIENIKDPKQPSYDLVRELVRYHLSDAAVPGTVGSDWLTYQGDGFSIRYPREATLVRAESHPSAMPGMAIQGPRIHVEVPPNVGPSDGPAYRLIVSSFPNPRGWSAEQWVDSLRREANSRPMDPDSLGYLAAPDTAVLATVRALRLQPFCGDCQPEELYVATPRRMIVVSYIFDISVPGDREAQRRLYRAVVSTLRPSD